MTLENAVVAHGSPTLARLKAGSLFTVELGGDFEAELAALNGLLRPKGVELTVLRTRKGRALMYLYRGSQLRTALMDVAVQAFLKDCGYDDFRIDPALNHLRVRLGKIEGFPHEIGVFLGYPLTDVVGFIRNDGHNCLCSGCWKVYSNECEALRAFARFRKCKEVYGRLFASGCPLSRLTVRTKTA